MIDYIVFAFHCLFLVLGAVTSVVLTFFVYKVFLQMKTENILFFLFGKIVYRKFGLRSYTEIWEYMRERNTYARWRRKGWPDFSRLVFIRIHRGCKRERKQYS